MLQTLSPVHQILLRRRATHDLARLSVIKKGQAAALTSSVGTLVQKLHELVGRGVAPDVPLQDARIQALLDGAHGGLHFVALVRSRGVELD